MTLTAVAKARRVARVALDKKAGELLVLDVQGLCTIGDYFVMCCGASTTHLETIATAVEVALKAEGVRAFHREGVPESGWVLLDYGDVVVHVFLPETREFYALERLWGDAPEVSVEV